MRTAPRTSIRPRTPAETSRWLAVAAVACMVVPVIASTAASSTTPIDPADGVFSTGFADRLSSEPATVFDAFLVASDETTLVDAVAAATDGGLDVLRIYDAFGILYVTGTGAALLNLADADLFTRIAENAPLEYYGDTAAVATRAREAWDAKSTSTNPVVVGGSIIDGSGVGVAVIDSGIDATHPDLAPAVSVNQKFVCPTPLLIYTPTDTCYGAAIAGILTTGTPFTGCTNDFWVAAADTDGTSGHGTHVAGIVAGRGIASDGRFMGTAPGATLYGLGTGEGIHILNALEALNWVKCNAASNNIRVVSNSWGRLAPYDPTDPINVAVDNLVSNRNIVVVFAAGNDGGSGSSDRVNTYARNPTAGVVSVANYIDFERAARDGSLAPSSSRCLGSGAGVSVASNCPDVSAPGSTITSTVSKTGLIPPTELSYMPYYGKASGTSMAAPHVSGIVAMLLQAAPGLGPATVESILEDNTIQFSTPGGYPGGINYGAGYGLVDAIASLEDGRVIGAAGLGSALPQLSQNPHVRTEGLVDPQVAAGVPPGFSLQWSQIAGRPVDLAERTMVTGNAAIYPIWTLPTANFRVEAPGGGVTNVAAGWALDDGLTLQMSGSYTFPAPGTYWVESQIDWGSGFVSFDEFAVRVYP